MLLFDLDGTLIDSNGVWLEVDKTFLAHMEESCEEIIAEWMELACDAYDHVPLKPHVREYLDRCREAGRRMAVFTACVPEHCRAAVENHGLGDYFERIIYAQELGEDKRSPAIFRHAAELLGVKPRECVFFDDSLAACKGAKAAGMTVVGVQDDCFTGAEADMRELCDRYIRDFGELL